jgi:DNA-binding transcriptional MerR regulator
MADRALGPRELARLTGVSTDTLRHYERKGLIPKAPRTASGYRRYAPDAVARVLSIQRALVVGFSLDELARVFADRDRGGAPCRGVRALVGERLDGLDRRIEELIALRGELRTLIKEWDARLAGTPAGKRVHLLDTLGDRPALEEARERRRRGRRDLHRK